MPPVAIAALAFASAFALGDWVARAQRRQLLEYVCKPAATAGLVALATLVQPASGLETRRAWFVAALALSLVGDVLLMVPGDRFVAGLVAFLVAHACYIVGFFLPHPSALRFVAAAAIVALVVLPPARHIVGSLGDHRRLRGPVVAYAIVISLMVAAAFASGSAFAAGGAVLFALSDGMIAWDRFVRTFRAAPVSIMVTYHLGQAGLVLSLLH